MRLTVNPTTIAESIAENALSPDFLYVAFVDVHFYLYYRHLTFDEFLCGLQQTRESTISSGLEITFKAVRYLLLWFGNFLSIVSLAQSY